MPDHAGSDMRSDSWAPEAGPPAPELDLAAALGGLDRATKDFTRRLGEAQDIAARAAALQAAAPAVHEVPPAPAPQAQPAPPSPEDAFDERLREAEREARLYLERAKQRADSLVATMIGAVEQEAAAIRRDAEDGIRARWQEVESDARRHLEEAVRVGDGIVAERQQHLAALSDGITGKAEALSAGLEDAERIRIQFEAFVRALSLTADRISQLPATGSGRRVLAELHDLPRTPRPSAIAA